MNCLVFTKVRNKEDIMFRAGLYGNYTALSESILYVKWSSLTLDFNWYMFSGNVMVYFFPLSFPLCLSSTPSVPPFCETLRSGARKLRNRYKHWLLLLLLPLLIGIISCCLGEKKERGGGEGRKASPPFTYPATGGNLWSDFSFPSQMIGGHRLTLMPMGMPSHLLWLPRVIGVCVQTSLQRASHR